MAVNHKISPRYRAYKQWPCILNVKVFQLDYIHTGNSLFVCYNKQRLDSPMAWEMLMLS